MESRFTPPPTPKSFRPVFIEDEKKLRVKGITESNDDEPKDGLLGHLWKWSLVLLSLLGLSVSTASLFATWLLNTDVSESFGGVIGFLLKSIEVNYGQMGILSFWLICLMYFFIMAYRSATRLK